MGRVIAIANQKGGVGKTTTAINLSASLGELGKQVLVIDCDPQGNTTRGLGIDKQNLPKTVYNLLLGECYIEEITQKTGVKNLSIWPANVNLAGAEIELIEYEQREYILKEIIKDVKYLYDYIIIDCPPSLSMLTINALTASDTVLVPIQCEFFALEGLSQLIHTIGLVQKKLNPKLLLEGVVFTMYDARTNLSPEVVEAANQFLPEKIYRSIVPRTVRLSEAPSHGMPITDYEPDGKGAQAYLALAGEVINRSER